MNLIGERISLFQTEGFYECFRSEFALLVFSWTVLNVPESSVDDGRDDSDELLHFRLCSDFGRLSFASTTRRTRSAARATAADGSS